MYLIWKFWCAVFMPEVLNGAHWARIRKKVQKPPHSTHQIPGFFLSKNPERVDCGGIFNSKFFKSDQKSTEIQWKSSHPPKRGWSDYEKTNLRWVVMLPSKGIHPLFRGSHLTEWKSKSDLAHFLAYFNTFWVECGGVEIFFDHILIWQYFVLSE